MQKKISLRLLPSEANDDSAIISTIASASGYPKRNIHGFYLIQKSIDARGRQVWINLTLRAFIDEPFKSRPLPDFFFKDVHHARKKVIVVGAGPAGLFAALYLIENGIQPIILERGKDVKARRRDLAKLNKDGVVNPESNYCFGEGGAGTYSDGKLYTRSNKRGDIDRVLNLLVKFGAAENILYESHPHIGTNKLPQIISAIRKFILECGGEFLFEKKLTDFIINNNTITGVKTSDGNIFNANAVILATGHSARDIFLLFHRKDLLIEPKPFALGVRIEHPQVLIDQIQYHCQLRDKNLPPASYNLVQQVNEKGVFSFCMCPGGIIAPAATSPEELVVNGWSPSKRNNPYANSGMVVQVDLADAAKAMKNMNFVLLQTNESNENYVDGLISDALLFMQFQMAIERKAFFAGGGKFVAPAQRMVDFTQDKISGSLPGCSYLPGLHSTGLKDILPHFIHKRLQQAFKAFGQKLKGYFTNDAVVVATESRTSSPVKIPRSVKNLNHPQVLNLYPCGEGAGYAGGIVSAAMDGERVAAAVIQSFVSSTYL